MYEERRINLELPNGVVCAVDVTFVAQNQAVLQSDPMSCLAADSEDDLHKLPDYRDLVELERFSLGKFRFVRVLKRARLRRIQFLLSDPEAQAKALGPVFSKAEGLGGHWEVVFGGFVAIWLPLGRGYDPTVDIPTVSNLELNHESPR